MNHIRSNLLLNSLNLFVSSILSNFLECATIVTGLSIIMHGLHPPLQVCCVKTSYRCGVPLSSMFLLH